MCGIIGIVGKPTDPMTSYHLASNLLRETKERGPHATGHYAVDLEGQSEMFKLPITSDQYIKLSPWKRVMDGTRALMGHCRWVTNGSAKNNMNNHPFVTQTGNLALIHNGKITDFDTHKSKYNLQTECDSEILLQVIAKKNNILSGIKEIYSLFGEGGDFACIAIYRNPNNGRTRVFVFREPGRTLVFADCREQLGQYFFISTAEIWEKAVLESKLHFLLKDVKVEEVPSYEIWEINAHDNLEIKKTKIEDVTKRISVVHQSYYSGYEATERWNAGWNQKRHQSKRHSSISSSSPSSFASLDKDQDLLNKLGTGWSKETNVSGQMVLIFDDQVKDKIVAYDQTKDFAGIY